VDPRTAPGKSDCIVIDHGGNVARHGFFEDSIDWILDNSKSAIAEHSAKPTIECPQCHRVYRGGKCSACDYEPTTAERAKSNLEFDGSELREIKPKDRKEPKQKTCEEIMISALYMAGRSGRTWKQALGIAYGLAKKQGTRFRVPKSVTVGGREYRMLPYGSPDQGRRVSALYEFTQ
jgi:hypothetical protein